jgi:hypothetical protein
LERSDGTREYRDDFIKAFSLNKRISAIAAGGANLAAFLLRELKKRIDADSYTPDLRKAIDKNLRASVVEYVNKTGRINESADMIFAGFNGKNKKRVDSAKLGVVASAEPRAKAIRGEGIVMPQWMDSAIVEALDRAIKRKGPLSKGTRLNVNVAGSEMFTVTVRTTHHGVHISDPRNVDCFDYAVFHPNHEVVTVRLPPDLLSRLEFEPVADQSPDAFLYRDARLLIGFVLHASNEVGFPTVGGHIFVLLQTPQGSAFPTGELGVVREGKIVNIGGIFERESDGAITYRLEDGREGEYHTIEKNGDLGNLECRVKMDSNEA